MKELTEMQKGAIQKIMEATDEQVSEACQIWENRETIQISELGYALLAALRSGCIPIDGSEYNKESIKAFCDVYQEQKRGDFKATKYQVDVIKNAQDATLRTEELLKQSAQNGTNDPKHYVKYIAEILAGLTLGILFAHFVLGF